MKIVDNITEKEYRDFFKKAKYNHFLQSYDWGIASKKKGQTPVYLALKDDNGTINAACMAFKKKTPLNMCYFYAPRGILIDYTDLELLNNFTEALKIYLKKQNAIYFKMDPGIVYQDIDENANGIPDSPNNFVLFNQLVSLGYKHKGFNRLFENNLTRYTFRINTQRSMDDIEKDMNKTYLKTIKRSYNYDLEIINEYDNEIFYKLMKDIAKKDGFNGYPKAFYQAFCEEFGKSNSLNTISIKIYPDQIINKAKNELEKIQKDINEGNVSEKKMVDTKNMMTRLEKDLEMFKPYENKYPNGIVSLTLICPKTDNAMWTLYIGNNELATYTFAVNRAYYEAIKIAVAEKKEYLDLFGTCGDPKTENKNYAGVHEYKRKMGGTYTEFIGEFDLIMKPFWNKVLPPVLKLYRAIRKRKQRIQSK